MRTRDHLGLTLGPLVLRITLGFVFVWAGYGKWLEKDFEGETAARMVNELKWADWAPDASAAAAQAETPATDDQAAPADDQAAPADDQGTDPGTGEPEPEPDTATETPTQPDQTAETAETAAPPTDKVRVRGLYNLALMLQDMELPFPRVLAWMVMITELVGGAMILIGLMTRFWSIGLAITMGVAFYLTMWGTLCKAIEGLPYQEWYGALSKLGHPVLNTGFLQISLFGVALALLFMGPGSFSFDRIFGSGPGTCERCERQKLNQAAKSAAPGKDKG